MKRTNKDSAANIEIIFHTELFPGDGTLYEEDETAITDLLTDLMHYCDARHESFDDHLYRARRHHRDEVEEERSYDDRT